MNASPRCYELIKSFENCELKAYPDEGGVWTIGWGHTGHEVVKGLVWSQAKADATLVEDVRGAEKCVNLHVTVPLTQGEFDALVSLVFNIGDKQFITSTLLRLLNNSDYDGAAAQILRWDHDNGKKVAGLTRRRKEEHDLFENWMV